MIVIRNYKESDVRALWDIRFRTIREVNIKDYSKEQVEAWAPASFDIKDWSEKLSRLSPFIAEIDGTIVGYADLQVDGLIDHFYCHYQYQGQGVGRALMEHLFKVGTSKGIYCYYSAVSITAKPFYEKFGFSVSREQLVEVRGQIFKNFLMTRSL